MTATRRNRTSGNRTRPVVFLLLLTVSFMCCMHDALANDTKNPKRVQQRNSYLDLWSNVFDKLDAESVDSEVSSLESHVEGMDSSDEGGTKHRLMDILEGRRKEKRSASLLKGLANSHGTIGPNLPGRMFGSSFGSGLGSKGGVGLGAGGVGSVSGKFRQVGIPVDNAAFQGKLCFRMQNLGNADKYYGVIAGSPNCDDADSLQAEASSMISWKSDSMFLIDCSIASVVQNTTDGSVASIRAALSKGTYSDGSLSQGVSSRASCSFSVVSEKTGGQTLGDAVGGIGAPDALRSHKPSAAMLKLTDVLLPTDHTIDVAPLNAVKVKLCDLSSAWSVGSTRAEGDDAGGNEANRETREAIKVGEELVAESSPDVTLSTLKLNGKRLASQELSADKGPTCTSHTYRVPSVGLSNDGFVLSGSMLLNEVRALGAGRASSVEISFGSVMDIWMKTVSAVGREADVP